MQKKNHLLIFLPLILILAIVVSATSTVAFASGSTVDYNVMFPSEDSYVELNNPTKIAVNDKIAIFDTNKIYTNKNNRFVKFDIPDTEITNLQISNDIVAYMVDKKIKIYNNNIDITEKLNSFLQKNSLENNYMFNIYLVNSDLLFVTSPNKLIKVTYNTTTNDFENFEQKLTHEGLFESKNISVFNNDLYFTTSTKDIKKIDSNNNLTTLFTYSKENVTYNDKFVVEFDTNVGTISVNNYSKNIASYTKEDLHLTDIKDVKVYNNMLYICTGNNVIVYNITDTGIVEEKNYGKTGNFKDKLNAPKATTFANDKKFVLDSGNSKIKDITSSEIVEYSIQNDVINFAINSNNNTFYYYTADSLYEGVIKDNAIKSIPVNNSKGLKQIKPFKDSILAVKDNILYKYNNNTNALEKLIETSIINFASSSNSDFIYINNGTSIDKYLYQNGTCKKIDNLSVTLSTHNIDNIYDFEIDNNGNIYALLNGKIATIKNNGLSYDKAVIRTLNNATYPIKNLVDIAVAKDEILLTDLTANLIYTVNEQTYTAPKANISLETKPLINEMSAVKTSKDTLIYTAKNSLESAFIVPKNEIVWVFNDSNLSSENAKLVYFYDTPTNECKLGYILDKNTTPVSKKSLNFNAITTGNTTLYIYPFANDIAKAEVNSVPKNTKMEVLCTLEGYDTNNGLNWYEVKYNNKRYFVIKNDLTRDTTTEENNDKIATMITKSSKMGEKVKMYAFSDLESKVIETIIDGETVEVLEKLDGFYKVKYNDKIGYIESINLIESGLTNNQLIAIIVSVITLVVAAIIFVTTLIIKNKKK